MNSVDPGVAQGGPWVSPLQEQVDEVATAFGIGKPDDLAITAVDLDDPGRLAAFRGDTPFYPASVVKIFYLVAAHHWLETRRIPENPEVLAAMEAMIRSSSNEATQYIVDLLTGTTSGPELSEEELSQWCARRNAVNEYFASLGYRDVCVNRKTWSEAAWGRDLQATRKAAGSMNSLTTNSVARLLAEIATGKAVSPRRSALMLASIRREEPGPDVPWEEFCLAPFLPPGSVVWSKAGWTSECSHVAACLALPGNHRRVLAIFTRGEAFRQRALTSVAKALLARW